ncbi:MAG TPA: carboxypeptidase-like regulatory domain-containing protein, partial [Burkholderiales bacterium]|nr:carboxypeptidase-like regulatory domain-containing protein [Burkholderiales bacterium]
MQRYAALCAMFAFSAVLYAQVNGTISGTVADPSGSAVAGATVRVISEGTGVVLTNTSDAEGNFVFTAVLPGIYT